MLIDNLSADYTKRELFDVFELPNSTYYSQQRAKRRVDTERQRLTEKVMAVHQAIGHCRQPPAARQGEQSEDWCIGLHQALQHRART